MFCMYLSQEQFYFCYFSTLYKHHITQRKIKSGPICMCRSFWMCCFWRAQSWVWEIMTCQVGEGARIVLCLVPCETATTTGWWNNAFRSLIALSFSFRRRYRADLWIRMGKTLNNGAVSRSNWAFQVTIQVLLLTLLPPNNGVHELFTLT